MGVDEKIATDRLAWRSFWLGISSILLLTLTGIPAIYFGVRSLLRMRFVRPKRGDQVAAVTGTLLGAFFGIFGGFIAVCATLVIMLRVWGNVETTDHLEVQQQAAEYFEFSSERLEPARSSSVFFGLQVMFEYADQVEREEQNVLLSMAHMQTGPKMQESMMVDLLINRRLQRMPRERNMAVKLMNWKLDGQLADVKKATPYADSGKDTDDNRFDQICHYYAYREIETGPKAGLKGISIVVDYANSDLTEADVKALFESIRICD
ncbi:MAG: hypothetical protein ACI87E_001653 [Mariniblastus sp.]